MISKGVARLQLIALTLLFPPLGSCWKNAVTLRSSLLWQRRIPPWERTSGLMGNFYILSQLTMRLTLSSHRLVPCFVFILSIKILNGNMIQISINRLKGHQEIVSSFLSIKQHLLFYFHILKMLVVWMLILSLAAFWNVHKGWKLGHLSWFLRSLALAVSGGRFLHFSQGLQSLWAWSLTCISSVWPGWDRALSPGVPSYCPVNEVHFWQTVEAQ